MQVALRLFGRGGEHAGHPGIDALQRREAKLRRGISVLQYVDQLFGRCIIGAIPPRPQQGGEAGSVANSVEEPSVGLRRALVRRRAGTVQR
jgi:hypothetical protein